jgi:AraC-like DNA-binding protein
MEQSFHAYFFNAQTLFGSSILLGFLLFFHPFAQNSIANKWLSGFLVIIALAFAGASLSQNPTFQPYPIIKIINSLQWLMGPFLFFGVCQYTHPEKIRLRKIIGHTVVFMVYLIIEINYGKETFMDYILYTTPQFIYNIQCILPIHVLVYTSFSYVEVLKYNGKIKKIASEIQSKDLVWLKQFLIIFFVVVLFWINDSYLLFKSIYQLTNLAYSVALFFLAYFSIKQKAIFNFKKSIANELTSVFEEPVSTNKSNIQRIAQDKLEGLELILDQKMEREKLFLSNDLSLADLAEKLEISIHDTSYLINNKKQTSFYNYVNAYRVEEAKRLLAVYDESKFNMLSIAFDSGFNSKTTFNTTFKKITGTTPTQYLKQLKNTQ